jgi:hypothetical protein
MRLCSQALGKQPRSDRHDSCRFSLGVPSVSGPSRSCCLSHCFFAAACFVDGELHACSNRVLPSVWHAKLPQQTGPILMCQGGSYPHRRSQLAMSCTRCMAQSRAVSASSCHPEAPTALSRTAYMGKQLAVLSRHAGIVQKRHVQWDWWNRDAQERDNVDIHRCATGV